MWSGELFFVWNMRKNKRLLYSKMRVSLSLKGLYCNNLVCFQKKSELFILYTWKCHQLEKKKLWHTTRKYGKVKIKTTCKISSQLKYDCTAVKNNGTALACVLPPQLYPTLSNVQALRGKAKNGRSDAIYCCSIKFIKKNSKIRNLTKNQKTNYLNSLNKNILNVFSRKKVGTMPCRIQMWW